MYKHISKLTEKDKAKILASYRNHAIRSYGMEWDEWANQIIQAKINRIFDDFDDGEGKDVSDAVTDTAANAAADAVADAAREFFNGKNPEKKPEPLEFLIWQSMKADGTVYVPSKMPVRAELKSRRMIGETATRDTTETAEEQSTAQTSSETAVEKTRKTASTGLKAKKTAKTSTSRGSRRRNNNSGGMSTIDKIRMIAAWAEGAMMPDRLHQLSQLSQLSQLPYKLDESKSNEERKLNQRKLLHSKLKIATAAIRENPVEFLKNEDFLDLMAFLKNTQHGGGGKFRLAGSFPSVLLRNKGLLRLLPLPVRIEKRPALAAEMAGIIAAKLNSRPMATNAANSANAADKVDTADTVGKSDAADKSDTADTANAANSADTANKSDKSVKAPNFNDIVLKELDDEVVIFDWFSTDDPGSEPGSPGSDEETMRLISDFLGTMLRAMGVLPPKK